MTNDAESPETRLAQRGQNMLLLVSILLALLTWIYLCFVDRTGLVSEAAGAESLTASQLGAWSDIALISIPLVLTLVPFIGPKQWRPMLALVGAAGAAIVAMLLALNGVGWFYIPAIAGLVAAYFTPLVTSGQRPGLARTNWNLVGALLVALPAIVLVGAMAAGTFAWRPVPAGIAIGCVALAAVCARGTRWVWAVVGLLGLAAMVFAAFDGTSLLMAFWVLGGIWVVTSLTALVGSARVVRRP